ncbi:endoglucanase 4-like [Eriocheir sinensis]|uniref:endoglucanase 4-like n=1 Tax=Eriocheir sinensis TaxID=95602 RepID=UPI0021C5BD55|nr:endoglucanase 4-like [Eriocheir sinensis]
MLQPLKLTLVVLALLGLHKGAEGQMCPVIYIDNEWDGNYNAIFSIVTTIPLFYLEVSITFDNPLDFMEYWQGTIEVVDSTHYVLTNPNLIAEANDVVEFNFHVAYSGEKPLAVEVVMNGEDVCDGTGAWTTHPPVDNPCPATGMTPYDYSQVLCMSYVFYEAQRSGSLPSTQRITWRMDSALDDGSDVGHDLTGGYYDAGDHVKFGFPMAFTATMLAWGLVDFAEGHDAAGQTDYGLEAVKWATDYFLKAYTDTTEFYGQVGLGSPDHGYWGPPEVMTMERPSLKIDASAPGSELAGETAAALAAASIAFKDVDSAYSDELLAAAKGLYDFADQYRGDYHNAITDAAAYYRSWSGYGDELCWAALWLYRATGDASYLDKAQAAWDEFEMAGDEVLQFSWDDKHAGVFALGSMVDPTNSQYETGLKTFLDFLKNDAPYTPEGLVFLDQWGANRHAANVAFIALWAAKYGDSAEAADNQAWGTGQIGQLLGDGERSFVVGYGANPPERPHHRSSSCPWLPNPCDVNWAQQQPGPNPHVLWGALVGGPSEDGTYVDERMDYVHNEVACDYNAAFSGALAALVELS